MLKLDELARMWETDSVIDKLELGDEAVRTQKLHAKYVVQLARIRLLLRNAEKEYNKMRALRWEWYRGTLSKEDLAALEWKPYLKTTPLKSERDDILDNDEKLVPLYDKVVLLQTISETLESIMKSIHSRTWDIKNTIEWTKYTAGLI